MFPSSGLPFRIPPSRSWSLAEIEGRGEVTCILPHARKRLQFKSPGDKLENRRGVIRCIVDVTSLGIGRHDDSGNARARTPTIAPSWSSRRSCVIPEAAVLVISDNHRHFAPLRAPAQPLEQVCNVLISAGQISV